MRRVIVGAIWLALGAAAEAATIAVSVDTTQDRRAIDPRIYGVNFGTAGQLADPGFTVRRWGGNHTTRYNYTTDVSNRGYDFVFLNVDEGGAAPPNQSALNTFLDETLAAGRTPLVTIGTIGWRPLDGVRAKRYGFSISKYGPQLRNGGAFDADGGNGECDAAVNLSGHCPDRPGEDVDLIVGNDPADTSQTSNPAWAGAWIEHLQARHADAVHFYALDNEPMLWNSTHRDVHPQPASYDEMWTQRTVPYATAIKNADPAAKIFGPVTWGYCDLFSSAADGCHVGDDRDAHEGLPFVQWYLRQVCTYQQQHGVRLVDYLDLHYYPQGQITPEIGVVDFGDGANDEMTAGLRLRSLKELYDPNWVAESWFADLGDFDANHYSKPQFLRRVKAWIAAECPDIKLAVTEYQWGSDHGASSALAHAEVLAIFGREGVDFATRWVAPEPGSRVERAFRLFLDYDGNGSRVEGDSVRAVSADVDALGAYAVDLPNQRTMLLLFNKATVANTAQIALNGARNGAWKLYRFDADNDVAQVASGNIAGTTLTLANLPARSANLLVLPSGSAPAGRIFADGFE